jgi:glycosyltransferase involved in cell wall biosynthesis
VFKGYVNNRDLKEYYTSHDVFILPSFIEAWGMVIDETLFYGTPILVSNRVGARELIVDGENGFWFDPYSSTDLADKIKNITNTEVLNKVKKGAKSFDINKKDSLQISAYHKALSQ